MAPSNVRATAESSTVTNYSIGVAAVNEKGDVGIYSDSMTKQTLEDSKIIES